MGSWGCETDVLDISWTMARLKFEFLERGGGGGLVGSSKRLGKVLVLLGFRECTYSIA